MLKLSSIVARLPSSEFKPNQGPLCFLNHVILLSLLSTGWFQEQVQKRNVELLLFSAHKIKPKNSNIDWENMTAVQVDCQYRALSFLVS